MKRALILLFFFVVSINVSAQKSYWKKKFNNGTLYFSVHKSSAKYGPHIREYFTNSGDGRLIAYKKSSYSNKYKLETKRGWSHKSYFYYKGSNLMYRNNRMGQELKLTKIARSDVPKYIREDAYFKRVYVRD